VFLLTIEESIMAKNRSWYTDHMLLLCISSAVCLVLVVALVQASSERHNEMAIARDLAQQLERTISQSRGIPQERDIENLKDTASALAASFEKLSVYPVRVNNVSKGLSALAFKEYAFSVQKKISETAEAENVNICRDIGFSKWDDKMPSADEIHDGALAVKDVKDILEGAIATRVTSVSSLSFSSLMMREEEGIAQQSRKVDVEVMGSYKAIQNFVSLLAKDSRCLSFDDIRIGLKKDKKKRGQAQGGDSRAETLTCTMQLTISRWVSI